MVAAIFLTLAVVLMIWLAVRAEGSVILEDLIDPQSLLAFAIAILAVIAAFAIPDMQGQRVPRWTFKIISCFTIVGLGCTIFPGAMSGRTLTIMSLGGWRRLGLVILAATLCLAIFL